MQIMFADQLIHVFVCIKHVLYHGIQCRLRIQGSFEFCNQIRNGRKHYINMPMQHAEILKAVK